MTHVVVRNGNVDGALKKFKQKVAKSGLPSEFKKREHYEKPGIRRRKAKAEAIKNSRKQSRRERD
jgi:small subunit ribosomal protein S21